MPCKHPFFATLKSTDRFQDTIAILDAKTEGYNTGVLIDPEGNVAGAPDANLMFLTGDGDLLIPPTEYCVPTLSLLRLMTLAADAKGSGDLEVGNIVQRSVSLEEAKSCAEAMLVGSQFPVMPITKWDGEPVGDGEVGVVSLQLRALLQTDVYPREGSNLHTEIPYGVLTGMGL